MTTLTEQDAARLQEIRAHIAEIRKAASAPGMWMPDESEFEFLLRLLDERPSGQFVTKSYYDARVAVLMGERDRLATALAASEARNVQLQLDYERLYTERARINAWLGTEP